MTKIQTASKIFCTSQTRKNICPVPTCPKKTGHFKFNGVIWVFPKNRVPQNEWCTMENPIKMDDLGAHPYFWKHPYLKTPKPINFQGLQGIRLMLPRTRSLHPSKKWGPPRFLWMVPFSLSFSFTIFFEGLAWICDS